MGKVTGFLEIERHDRGYDKPDVRRKTWTEFLKPLPEPELAEQAARCMDCGIPFCHQGCPVNNLIPDWNNLVYRHQWRAALRALHSTNNFPEFTGRVCPAPCEASCTLNIDDNPVTIKTIECAIVDRGWDEGWIKPQPPSHRTDKRVAVVGSGPAGMACAQQLARAGHTVTLFEKNDRIGGLLRYGIPDFKMEKHLVNRRIEQMTAEGVVFRAGVEIGVTLPMAAVLRDFDTVVLACGAEWPRDLEVPGRDLDGIHFAMDFLTQQNKRVAGDDEPRATGGQPTITAMGKHVVVIGGGDTGSDCIGTSFRQGAASVTQLEILPKPPEHENKALVWPDWPLKLRTSHAHEEGADRDWAVLTKRALGLSGKVEALECVRVEWVRGADGRLVIREIPGSQFLLKADLVLLAMGFIGPRRAGLVEQLRVELDSRGNVAANVIDFRTNLDKVFAAGDMRRGQSLVVWAIREGRECAQAVEKYLMGGDDPYVSVRRTVAAVIQNLARETDLTVLDAIIANMPGDASKIVPDIGEIVTAIRGISQRQKQLNTSATARSQERAASQVRLEIQRFHERAPSFGKLLGQSFEAASRRWLEVADVQLLSAQAANREAPRFQVFRAGDPVNPDREAFVPRKAVLDEISDLLLLAAKCPALILYGRRRTGKTTTLRNLPAFLPAGVRSVTVSMLDPEIFDSTDQFCLGLAQAALQPWLSAGEEATVSGTGLRYLMKALNSVDDQAAREDSQLLIAIDEYERLDHLIGRGRLSPDILAVLRESIQKHQRIIWMFAGSHHVAELGHMKWTSYLVSARTIEVPLFSENETRLLLTQPLQHSPEWSDRPVFPPTLWGRGIIERIYVETAGWPHLVQLVAEHAISNLMSRGLWQVDDKILEVALAQAVTSGDTVLRELIIGECRDPAELEYVREFRRHTVLPPPDNHVVRDALRQRLLIVEQEDGWRLRVPLMQRWLREEG